MLGCPNVTTIQSQALRRLRSISITAENERVINALRSGEEYIVLEAERPHYTLFQLGSDRIPLEIKAIVAEIAETIIKSIQAGEKAPDCPTCGKPYV